MNSEKGSRRDSKTGSLRRKAAVFLLSRCRNAVGAKRVEAIAIMSATHLLGINDKDFGVPFAWRQGTERALTQIVLLPNVG